MVSSRGEIGTIAATVRARERLRFDYEDRKGSASRRAVEPHRLVNAGRRWYLVAWDTDRTDWRTFRVDRLRPYLPLGERIGPWVGTVVADGDERCSLETGADSLELLAVHLGMLDADFSVTEPPELVGHLRSLAERYGRATAPSA